MTGLARLHYAVLSIVLVVGGVPAAGLAGSSPGNAEATEATDLLAEAEIVRDDHGVAHIYTEDRSALWYANGYVQAEDRLWALDLVRHLSYGEGASVVGPAGGILEMDLNTRLNLYNESNLERQFEEADPAFKEAIEAYTDGVNRAAAEMHASGEMPAEFQALQHAFEPWEAIDTVAVATFLLAEFGNGGGAEVANAQLFDQLRGTLDDAHAQVAFDDLNWDQHPDADATIQASEYTAHDPQGDIKDISSMPPAQQAAMEAASEAQPFGLATEQALPSPPSAQAGSAIADVPDVGFFAGEDLSKEDIRLGSNALVVAPSLSATGEALLGGGPQMGYFNPQIPYEVGLHHDAENPDEDLEAEGMGVIGAPGVIIGSTDDFSLTVTSGISDQTDQIALPAADEDDRSFEWTDEEGNTVVRDLDCRTERHRIFAPPALWAPAAASDPANAGTPVDVVEQEVCRADLSPVDQPAEKTYPVTSITRDDDGEPETFFAEKISSRMEEVDSAIQWLTLMEADNFDEFEDHFEGFAFTFNFHYAGVKEDTDSGEAACYVHVGRQPVRDQALDPRFPTPAGDDWLWQVQADGDRYLTGDELPRTCNPDKGYLANWNNLPQDGWSSGDTRELWGSIHRVERLDQEVQEAITDGPGDEETLTQADVRAILEDAATEDSLANQIVPLLSTNYASKLPSSVLAALADWQAGGEDSDFPWRSGVPGTPAEEAQTSNASREDHQGGTDHVYVDRGHTVYDRLLEALMDEVFADELGDHARGVSFDPRNHSDVHAGDHGQHRNVFAILVDALAGTTDRDWCDDADTVPNESCGEQVADAVEAAGLDVDDVEAIPYTGQHLSPFTSLGVGPAYEIPMTNRATYYHFHAGTDVSTSQATLPPGISGHMNAADFVAFTATGEEPEHMQDQLDLYVDFELKDVPWGQAETQATAQETRSLLVPTAG